MIEHPGREVYESVVPYSPARIGAAAVYCSDGRLGEHCDDFLQNALGLPRYDRLIMPGGAACLADHFDAWRDREVAREQLKFLVEAHGLERVILVAHEDCAFYTQRLKVSPLGLLDRQHEDLRKAARCVKELSSHVEVETWYAHFGDGVISFDPVT